MLHLSELHVESVPFESQDTRSHELDGRLDAVSYSVLQSFKEDFGDAISDPTSNISFFDLVQSVPCPSPAPSYTTPHSLSSRGERACSGRSTYSLVSAVSRPISVGTVPLSSW